MRDPLPRPGGYRSRLARWQDQRIGPALGSSLQPFVEQNARALTMIIDGVEVVHVAMPLIYPWRTAYGADPVIESVLVKFTSGSNEAWGEACTLGAPTYSPEHAAGIFCVLKEHFVNLVVGKEFDTSEDLQYALRWFKGNQFAKVRLLPRHRSSRIT